MNLNPEGLNCGEFLRSRHYHYSFCLRKRNNEKQIRIFVTRFFHFSKAMHLFFANATFFIFKLKDIQTIY